MATPQAPKLLETLKMLVVPAVFMFSKKVDFKDENVVMICQTIFVSVVVIVLSIYYYIYTRINAKKDDKVIWVPPKAKPSLPFGLGPAPEPLKPEEFEKTTYKEYELKLVKEVMQQTAMNAGITFFMGYQFKIYLSLLIQPIMIPMGLFDSVVFQKYVLGQTKQANGDSLYNELFKQPTAETIAMIEKIAKARAEGADAAASEDTTTANLTPSVAVSAIDETEPRVVELSDSEKSKTKEEDKTTTETPKRATTAANELD